MSYFKNTGLLLCLSLSALLPACDDDDLELVDASPDAGRDGGARSDASVISLDAGLDASIDSSVPTDASSSDAATGTTYNLTLTKAAEVPPCELAGAGAAGTATVTLSPGGDSITVNIAYEGLSGIATLGHIHYGAAGTSGPFVLPFGQPLASPIVRVLTEAQYEALGTAPASFPAFVAELRAGKAYVNIHTVACGSGEIRAQIQ
ncbi:MAG TPA: CHRD domain-containing protein [Polyangiales bacterium]|nr:CHRD domain-containing protein [Polyangiales bacterium]